MGTVSLLLPSSGAEKQRLTDISAWSWADRVLEEAEAAVLPQLWPKRHSEGLVMGRSGTKEARIPVGALLPERQGSWKWGLTLPPPSLQRHVSSSWVFSFQARRQSQAQAPVPFRAAVKGEKGTDVFWTCYLSVSRRGSHGKTPHQMFPRTCGSPVM